jgi:hypothetical protein
MYQRLHPGRLQPLHEKRAQSIPKGVQSIPKRVQSIPKGVQSIPKRVPSIPYVWVLQLPSITPSLPMKEAMQRL